MKLAMLLTALALGAKAEPSAVSAISQDPLMRRILSSQIVNANGGVTGVVRLGSGQSIAIDPLAGIKPAEGLVEKPAKVKPAKPVKRAKKQLETVSDAGDKARF